MIVYPAIDMKGGNIVRLFKGDMDQETVYGNDPAAQAKRFEDDGFQCLHLVDLDGAVGGTQQNAEAVKSIIDTVDIPVQLGGGIRTLEHIEAWVDLGVRRIILGTIAVKSPEIVEEACREFPDQIAVGIDARGMDIAVQGWTESTGLNALEFAKKVEGFGIDTIIYTDIDRDGTGDGVNVENTLKLAQSVSVPVIASGGVGSVEDIKKLKVHENDGIHGVIVGKAIYDGRIAAKEALDAAWLDDNALSAVKGA